MLIDLRDPDRRDLGRYEVDVLARPAEIHISPPPDHPDPTSRDYSLHWENALDSEGRLVRCPGCRCRDLFRRKDFPQGVGILSVVAAGAASIVLFALAMPLAAVAVLAATVLVDACLAPFIPQCLVCHRCRSEFRRCPIAPEIEPFDLAIGEKYRPIRGPARDTSSSAQ